MSWRVLRDVEECEVVAGFLRAEIDSGRWGGTIRGMLARDRRPESILRTPNLEDSADNAYRRGLLGEFRGWPDRLYFAGFPQDVSWSRVALDRADLRAIRYIDYPYWVELSGGTRRPSDAAARLRSGLAEVDPATYLAIASQIRAGVELPEMILVSDGGDGRIVVLEGNARLTGYALAGERTPAVLTAFLGSSAVIREWGCY